MYIPAGSEHVQIVGRLGEFLVLHVNHNEKSAHVIGLDSIGFWTEDIPFTMLRPYEMDVAA